MGSESWARPVRLQRLEQGAKETAPRMGPIPRGVVPSAKPTGTSTIRLS